MQNAQNQFGAGMQNTQNRQQTNLQNAQNLLGAMNTNAGFQQQANVLNAENQQACNMQRSGTQAGFAANQAGQYGAALLNRANDADVFNTTNQINRAQNQAQLDRQRDMFNVGTGENRYGQAFNMFGNLTSGSNAVPYFTAGQPQYQPNLATANTLSSFARDFKWPPE